MKQYKVTSDNLLYTLTVENQTIGTLQYKNWFGFQASIFTETPGSYEVVPKGFWGSTIELLRNGESVLSFEMKWNGEIGILARFNDEQLPLTFRHNGFFKESFTLSDEGGEPLVVLRPVNRWSKMSYEYELNTSDDFEALAGKELLLIISIYCANYFLTMMSAVYH